MECMKKEFFSFFLMICWQTPLAQCFTGFIKHKAISLCILSFGLVSVNMGKPWQKSEILGLLIYVIDATISARSMVCFWFGISTCKRDFWAYLLKNILGRELLLMLFWKWKWLLGNLLSKYVMKLMLFLEVSRHMWFTVLGSWHTENCFLGSWGEL